MKVTEVQTKYLKDLKSRIEGSIILAEVNASNLISVVSSLYHEYELPLLTIKATDQRKIKRGFVIY